MAILVGNYRFGRIEMEQLQTKFKQALTTFPTVFVSSDVDRIDSVRVLLPNLCDFRIQNPNPKFRERNLALQCAYPRSECAVYFWYCQASLKSSEIVLPLQNMGRYHSALYS